MSDYGDAESNAYFEFSTNYYSEVKRVIENYGHTERVDSVVINDEMGPECVNCGNVAGTVLPSICPVCSFRDISPCPVCQQEIARQAYIHIEGDLFKCPSCEHRVRFRLHDPLFDSNGLYQQPLVSVDRAGD